MNASQSTGGTRVLRYDDAAIAEAARLIKAGEVVAIPTETVYGLAADAESPQAVAAIYAAKGRPASNPLIVHVGDLAQAKRHAEFDMRAETLAAAFWPGPLTLVLPRRAGSRIAALATAGLDTIAIRVPAHRAMQALIAASDRPIAAPSANASGGISPTRAAHVLASLGGRIPLIIDDGPCDKGLESTIVAELDGMSRILRHGPVSAHALSSALLTLSRDRTGTLPILDESEPGADGAVIAPGQSPAHYAPAKPLRIGVVRAERDEWMIGFGAIDGDATLSESGDLDEAASRLFALLHEADASDRHGIAVAPVPGRGLGAAINDRLRRAAHRG